VGKARRAIAVAVAAALSAALASAEPAAMLPLTPGATWTFSASKKTTISAGAERNESSMTVAIEETVTDPSPLSTPGKPVFVIRQRIEERGASSVRPTVFENALHLSSTASGIWLHRVDLGGGASRPLVTPRALFTDPPSRGPLRGDVGPIKTALEITQQTRENIKVPAGEFADAFKVVAEGTVSGKLARMPIRSGTGKVTSWFVRGVGLVREDRVLDVHLVAPNGEDGRNIEESSKVLESYRPASATSPTNTDAGRSEPTEIPLPILR
jgi:hypothetical protein